MASWAYIKFYYQTMLGAIGSALYASSTASGDYDAAYLYNMMETNKWSAAIAAAPCYVSYDAGLGKAYGADYLAILGHNLKSIGATIVLQYSSDGINYTDAFTAIAPIADTVILKEFTQIGTYRYWRLVITGTLSAPPTMTICIWGLKTELDYVDADFDPYEQEDKSNVLVSPTGYLLGVYGRYIERTLKLSFQDADASLYAKVKSWWETNGLKNFFVAWEIANNPDDVYLMHSESKFSSPFVNGGAYRNITLTLKGRKE